MQILKEIIPVLLYNLQMYNKYLQGLFNKCKQVNLEQMK